MKLARKVRADSKLKNLPPARQAQIAEHLQAHKLPETAAWLRELGIDTSATALSEFLSSYRLQQHLEDLDIRRDELLQEVLRFIQAQERLNAELLRRLESVEKAVRTCA